MGDALEDLGHYLMCPWRTQHRSRVLKLSPASQGPNITSSVILHWISCLLTENYLWGPWIFLSTTWENFPPSHFTFITKSKISVLQKLESISTSHSSFLILFDEKVTNEWTKCPKIQYTFKNKLTKDIVRNFPRISLF